MAFDAGAITGTLDLDHTRFDKGFEEAFSHAETEGGRIREILESLTEVVNEALGPAFAQLGQQIMSAFAGFSEGPIVGALNLIGLAAGGLREATEAAGAQFHQMALASERAGVSVEWMSKLAAVGGTVGVGLDQLQMGFRILEQRAGEASEGNKQAITDFNRLGISAQEAASLMGQPAQLFQRVQEAISHVGNASERTTAALGLLGGRGGSFLVPLLNMSGQQFDALGGQMERLGGVVDEQDAQVGEALGRLEGYFNAAWLGIERAVSKPVLQYLDQHMAEIEPRIESAVSSLSDIFSRGWQLVGGATEQLLPDLEAIGTSLQQAGTAAEPLGQALATIGGATFHDLVEALKGLTPEAVSAIKSLGDLASEVSGPLKIAFEAVEPIIQHVGSGLKDLAADANVAIQAIAGIDTSKLQGGGVTQFLRNYAPHVLADYDSLKQYVDQLHQQAAFSGEVADLGFNPYDRNAKMPAKLGDDSGVTIDHVHLAHVSLDQDTSGLTLTPEWVHSTPQIPVPPKVVPSPDWLQQTFAPAGKPPSTPDSSNIPERPGGPLQFTPSPLDFAGLPPIRVPSGEMPLLIPPPDIDAQTAATSGYATPIPTIEPPRPAHGRRGRGDEETADEPSRRSRRRPEAANASESAAAAIDVAGPLNGLLPLLGQATDALRPMAGSLGNFRQAVDDATGRLGELFSAASRALIGPAPAAPAGATGAAHDAAAQAAGPGPTVNQSYTVNVEFDPRDSINQFAAKLFAQIAALRQQVDGRFAAAAAHAAGTASLGGGH